MSDKSVTTRVVDITHVPDRYVGATTERIRGKYQGKVSGIKCLDVVMLSVIGDTI